MIIKKPEWVSHSQYPIFCIDIHPDGSRFVTGGGDNKIKIWNMKALDSAEEQENVPRLLASLEEGSPVNCVRFSPDGKLLATAADDRTILLWELREGTATKIFGSDDVNTENWCRVAALVGHTSDVNDLCWAPDASMIVSCSLAKEVFVWDAHKRVKAATLAGHSGFVKGVAWDPLGKFIASQSDDKSVIIWRVSDWKIEKQIKEPFKLSAGSAFYRRLSWSPDGSFLTTTHGFNGPSHVAPILDRTNWTVYCDFVGHKKPVVCSKFNPTLFLSDKPNAQGKAFAYCAIGSQDCSVSVWSTLSQRPKVVCKQVFNQSVLDIAWAANGEKLLCCSTDGSVAYFSFEKNELGTALSPLEQREKMRELYGDSIYQPPLSAILAETPDQLQLEKETKTTEEKAQGISSAPAAASLSASTPAKTLVSESMDTTSQEPTFSSVPAGSSSSPIQQKETILQNGRRRITPQFLGQASPSKQGTSSLSNSGSSLPLDIPKPSQPKASTTLGDSTSLIDASGSSPESDNRQIKRRRLKKHSESTKPKSAEDGKDHESERGKAKEKEREKGKEKEKEKEKGKEKGKDKEKEKGKEKEKEKGKDRDKDKEDDRVHKKPGGHPPTSSRRTSGISAKSPVVSKLRSSQNVFLPLPDRAKTKKLQRQLNAPDSPLQALAEPLFLEVSNYNASAGAGEWAATVSCREGGKLLWEDLLRPCVTAIAGNSLLSAVGCEDGSLFLYTPAGRRMFPCIYLGSGVVHLEANANRHLAAITSDCSIHIWDAIKMESILQGSVAPLLDGNNQEIERVRVLASGQCVITLSNYCSFTWVKQMGTWMRVGDNLFSRSSFASRLPASEHGEMPLASVQASVQKEASGEVVGSALLHTSAIHQSIETMSHLENQLAAALALESPIEYRYWLHTYTRYLASEAALGRLDELAASLLGPAHRPSGEAAPDCPSWQPQVLGMSKRKLLDEILPIMSSNRACQRLVAQYKEYLTEIRLKEMESS